jgi:hypothetical protein
MPAACVTSVNSTAAPLRAPRVVCPGGACAGGRGAAAGEQLEPLEQQAGLDAPYGSRTADQESGAIDQGKGKPAAQQRQPGEVGSGQGETPGKVAGTQL